MTSKEFEAEIRKLDPRFTVIDNPNWPLLSNIMFEGKNYDLPAISKNDIKEEIDFTYRHDFGSMQARYWSRPEIVGRLEAFLKLFKDNKIQEFYD